MDQLILLGNTALRLLLALCIGGGICKEGDTLIKPLTEKVMPQTYARKPENRTKIIVAKLGNDAGIIGAALLGMEKK